MGASHHHHGRPSPATARVEHRIERVRHVWVAPSEKHPQMPPYPGLLLTWQRRDGGWWAHVVMLLPDGTLVVNWLSAARVRPVTVADG